MTKAIETGLPKLRIEEAAAQAQARIDAGRQTIVGVNRWRPAEEEAVPVLTVDHVSVRARQIERLRSLKAGRDAAAVADALAGLTACAQGAAGNLLELSVTAARAGATVGEMTAALERVWGRHTPSIRAVSGVYTRAMGENAATVTRVRRRADDFARRAGRRPRILVAKIGQDGHDRGQKVIATAFADFGWDVDIGPLFLTPAEVARQAAENDVHVIGVSSLAAGHLTLVPELRRELDALGRSGVLMVVGGVVPAKDVPALRAAGAAAVFGPGTVLPAAAEELLAMLERGLPAA